MLSLIDGVVTGSISATQEITGAISVAGGVTGVITVGGSSDLPEYAGIYTVTPGAEAQTLETAYRIPTDNIVVAAIPQNYGLITWNGSFLTVS